MSRTVSQVGGHDHKSVEAGRPNLVASPSFTDQAKDTIRRGTFIERGLVTV